MVPYRFNQRMHQSFKTSHLPNLMPNQDLESLFLFNPDLVVTHSLQFKPERVTRLREGGVRVLDLGSMRGFKTLREDILQFGQVVGEESRAIAYASRLERRLKTTAKHISKDSRKTAIWLAIYGDKLMGGTVGSGYHDVLTWSGMIDVMEGQAETPWPGIRTETVLKLNPQVIVTDQGMENRLKKIPGFDQLQAVSENRIIELPKGSDTSGPAMVETCEWLCDKVYGPINFE